MTTAFYKAAECEVLKRDARHRWRVHLRTFLLVNVAVLVVALITRNPVWLAIPFCWAAPLTVHYLHAGPWFDRDNRELQGRIVYVAQQMERGLVAPPTHVVNG